ncbi:copper(I)-binding protein [Luteibacter sp. HA06]
MTLRSLAIALLLVAGVANATDSPTVKASNGWLRVLPGSLPAGGYVSFENVSDRAVSIVGASSPDYADAMIHRSSTDGGMGRMEMVDSVPLPPKGTVAFSPGGYHVMLMDAKHPVKPGDKLVVTFKLSDGETLPVTLLARPANATGPTD